MHTLHKLLFAKLCTCYCVCFLFVQPSLKIPWFLCKTYLMFEILREWIENLNFGKTGFKTCVFEKHFISYSCTWFIKFNALRSFCIILLCFSKKLIFPEFRLIEIVFWSIKIAIKSVCESLFVLIGAQLVLNQLKYFRPIESIFRSIENRVENFSKTYFHVFKLTFSKVFQLFLSLYDLVKAPIRFFIIFHHSFCKVFVSQGR